MSRTGAAVLVGLVFAASCSKSGGSSTPTAPTTPTTPQTVSGCEMLGSTPGTPIVDPNGPIAHNVAFGTSADGVTVTNPREVLARASVPDVVRLPDGTTGIYYINAETDGVWLGRLSGTTLTPISAITIDGVLRPRGVVDPDAVIVSGRVRLAYLRSATTGGTTRRAMCLAESTDGLTFTTLANAWDQDAGSTTTDPSLVQLPNGTWLMAISNGTQTRLGRSTTGLSFTEYGTVTGGGVPELALTSDNRVRLYVCENGITSYISPDSGTSWTREASVVPRNTLGRTTICDPSYSAALGLFVFKTQ